jgi:hypothetical protein
MASLAAVSGSASDHHPMLSPRGVGLAAGLVISAGFAALQHVVSIGSLLNLNGLPWVLPMLFTGGFVGWLFGRAAWRAHGRATWAAIVVGQGLLAVVVGAFAVAFEGFFVAGLLESGDPLGAPAALLLTGLLTLYGLAFLGWAVAPFTLTAALLWALAVVQLRGLVDGRGQGAG